MLRKNLTVLFICVIICIISRNVHAEQSQDTHRFGQGSEWSVRMGLIGISMPVYEGSDEYRFVVLPLVDVTWRDTVFLNPQTGLGAYIWNRSGTKAGLSLGYRFQRDEDDSDDLNGLGDVEGGVTANVFVTKQTGDLMVNVGYEQQISGEHTGFLVRLGIGYILLRTDRIFLQSSVNADYASSDFMESYFEIHQAQARRSGLAEYDTGPGFKSVGARLLAVYSLTDHWGIQGIAAYERMIGDAADSPVVKDENQYRIGLGMSYDF